jgi:hypothetical protein
MGTGKFNTIHTKRRLYTIKKDERRGGIPMRPPPYFVTFVSPLNDPTIFRLYACGTSKTMTIKRTPRSLNRAGGEKINLPACVMTAGERKAWKRNFAKELVFLYNGFEPDHHRPLF